MHPFLKYTTCAINYTTIDSEELFFPSAQGVIMIAASLQFIDNGKGFLEKFEKRQSANLQHVLIPPPSVLKRPVGYSVLFSSAVTDEVQESQEAVFVLLTAKAYIRNRIEIFFLQFTKYFLQCTKTNFIRSPLYNRCQKGHA